MPYSRCRFHYPVNVWGKHVKQYVCCVFQCITNAARKQGISSSLLMPDKVLNFVKDHFLMDSVIRSQPLLLKRNVRYTQIAVHRVQAAKKVYNVLFIGTGKQLTAHKHSSPAPLFYLTSLKLSSPDDGRLHKAINVNKKMHIIEEMVLFRDSQPVQHIELDTEKVHVVFGKKTVRFNSQHFLMV